MIDLKSKKVEKVAILGGTTDLVERDESDGGLCEIEERMKKPVTLNKNENFKIVLIKLIGRSGKKRKKKR